MRVRLTCLLASACLLCGPGPARAILIETGPNQRVAGYLVSGEKDAKRITVRVQTPDGKSKEQDFDITKVKIIHKVDQERLGKLTKDNPRGYFDYAQQLAKIADDPEATDLALRLYLIAAYLEPAKRGPDCLQHMSALAARPADADRFRAMAFLLDAKSNQALLQADAGRTAPKAARNELQYFCKALRHYRNGEIKDAIKAARQPGVDRYFTIAPGLMDRERFVKVCNDANCTQCGKSGVQPCAACNGTGRMTPAGPQIQPGVIQVCTKCNGKGVQKCPSCNGSLLNKGYSDDYLEDVLRAEVWALDQLLPSQPDTSKSVRGGSWYSALNRGDRAPAPSLSLETITEYDPRECIFRNGKWVAP
jgi:hypothetical protein